MIILLGKKVQNPLDYISLQSLTSWQTSSYDIHVYLPEDFVDFLTIYATRGNPVKAIESIEVFDHLK